MGWTRRGGGNGERGAVDRSVTEQVHRIRAVLLPSVLHPGEIICTRLSLPCWELSEPSSDLENVWVL